MSKKKYVKAGKPVLNQRMELFCLKYVELGNIGKAALAAGYSPKTFRCQGSLNLLKPHVRARIAEIRQKIEDALVSTEIERRRILTEIERAKVGDFVDEHGNLDIQDKKKLNSSAIAEIKTERTLVGVKTTLKLRDPVSAIAEHNKMDKVYSAEAPGSVTNNVQINIITRDEKAKELVSKIMAGERLLAGSHASTD